MLSQRILPQLPCLTGATPLTLMPFTGAPAGATNTVGGVAVAVQTRMQGVVVSEVLAQVRTLSVHGHRACLLAIPPLPPPPPLLLLRRQAGLVWAAASHSQPL